MFVARDCNYLFFDKFRVILPIFLSAALSMIDAVTVVLTSEIKRTFYNFMGFIDVGQRSGLRNMINRFFYLFPIGSVLCYIILFYHLLQKTKTLSVSSQQNRGERKVFVQILITAVFYGITFLIQELLALIEFSDVSAQIFLISFLNIFNYLPEMSLPLLMLLSNSQLRTKISKLIAPKQSSSIPQTQPPTSTSMR